MWRQRTNCQKSCLRVVSLDFFGRIRKNVLSTVKAVLTITFKQGPPVNHDHPDPQGAQMIFSFTGGTSE
jgi:hypothetical protein